MTRPTPVSSVSPVAPTAPIEVVAVVVPVRDEQERIGGCLDALAVAVRALDRAGPGRPAAPRVRVVAVLDRCTDGTAAVVARQPWVTPVVSRAGRVGAARAIGVTAALRGETVAPRQIWIATTDADSRVPPDWLTHQLDLAAAGADLFRGLVEPDRAECGPAAYDAWALGYQRRDGHAHVHGANLGVRGDVYAACGGFDEVAGLDEDVALSRQAQLAAYTVVASAQAIVATSGRLVGRVEGAGFAAHLRDIATA